MSKTLRERHRRIVAVYAAVTETLESRRLLSGGNTDVLPMRMSSEHGPIETTPVRSPVIRDADGDLPGNSARDTRGGRTIDTIPPFPLSDTFLLHSRASATKTIYLDFDGHLTSGTFWNEDFTGNADIDTPEFNLDSTAGFSDAEKERIQKIWQRVMEDFAPFDVDVTTEQPTLAELRNTGGADNEWGILVSIGGNGSWLGSAGGVAYIGSFDWDTDEPCFVFPDNLALGDEKSVAEAITHEVGHTLGLEHDGRISPAEGYYLGHGSGATGWAPVMGVGYYQDLVQWSKGEYASANQTQDDLNIITTSNGFGYRVDDAGNTNGTAKPMTVAGASLTGAGVIERNTDVDVWSFTTAGGAISLDIDPFVNSPNLDIQADLYNSSGGLVGSNNPTAALDANVTTTLTPGTYYLHVTGVGKGDPLGTGYTDYGSIGQYTISNGVPAAAANDAFAGRFQLSGTTVNTAGSSLLATKEAGEPNHAGNTGGASVWWTWTAPSSHSYVVTTAGSTFDTLLGIYTGSTVGALTPVASNNDQNFPTTLTSRAVFNAVAGTVYQIAVDGVAGATGNVSLGISRALHNITGTVYTDRNTNATKEGPEPGLQSRTVYIDSNSNGTYDNGSTTLASSDVPKGGIDESTAFSNLIVSGLGTVADVNVNLSITHNWDPDLDVYLISPTGTRVELFTDVGQPDADNFSNTTLDDEAATAITAGSAPFTGSFRPEGLLSAFDGQSANGTWQLEVTDDEAPDAATLTSWSLTITYAETSATTDSSGNYSFAGLVSGNYNVRSVTPAGWILTAPVSGSQNVSLSLGTDATARNFANFPTTFAGSNGDDNYGVSTLSGGSTIQIVELLPSASTVIYTIPKSTLGAAALTLSTGTGDDAVIIDHLNGSPVPTGGSIVFNGGANTATGDSLLVQGATAADNATFTSSGVTLGGTTTVSNNEKLSFDGKGGFDTVAINSGAVVFPATQRLQNLTMATGTSLSLPAGGNKVLLTRGMTLNGTAKLELQDNDLIYDYSGTSQLSYVEGKIAAGLNGGTWDGSGLVTTQSQALAGLTTIGMAEASVAFGLDTGTDLFAGQTIDSTCIIVKYTYMGDANLDGLINGDDYANIDFNAPTVGANGYVNGDFNYDGVINGDDYAVIDFNANDQGAPL